MRRMIFRSKLFGFHLFVALILMLNKMLIRIILFKKLIKFYSNTQNPVNQNELDTKKVKLIHDTINRHEKILFWKPVCFEKALTAMMLARIFHLPATVYFGIMKTEQGTMLAHAWSQIGDYWITGYENKDEFTVVYTMYYAPGGNEE